MAADLAAVLAEVLKVEQVPLDGHFFDDLGADSLVMAQFCARAAQAPRPPASVDQGHLPAPHDPAWPGSLAGHDGGHSRARGGRTPLPARRPEPSPRQKPAAEPSVPNPADAPMSRSKPHYVLCGLLQLLLFLGASTIASFVLFVGFDWISASPTAADIYLRSLIFGGGTFAATCLLSIVAKWTLIGRWTPRQIPVWSLEYVRFWLVKTLIRTNPLVRFAGTPLYSLYLRALGAKIGRGVAVFSPSAPVCTDLLTIGSHTVIRKDSVINGYRAVDGVIQIGPVTLGSDVYIGESTVLDIGTSMGDGAQLGHSSSLHTGQSVPAGESWHGSPAEPTSVDHRMVRTGRLSMLRWIVLPLVQLVVLIGVTLPVSIGGLTFLYRQVPQLAASVGDLAPAVSTLPFYRDAVVLSTVLFFGSIALGLLVVATVPRLLALVVRPDRDYPLYGIRYLAHRTIVRITNRRFFTRIFGDSSYIVYYLRSIGYDLSNVEQTGSNFGLEVKHENPFLSAVGSGTVVADGLSIINADYSSTHFRLSRVSDRGAELPRQPDRLPGPGPHRRQLPAGDEGHGPARREGPRGRRPARLAQLRDPADGRPGPPAGRDRPGGAAAQARRQDTPQHGQHPAASAVPLAAHLHAHRVHAGHLRPLLGVRPGRRAGGFAGPAADHRVLPAGRAGGAPPAGAPAERLLDLRPRVLAARAVLEGLRRHLHPALQRHPVQEPDLAVAGRSDRPSGLRRRVRAHRAHLRHHR